MPTEGPPEIQEVPLLINMLFADPGDRLARVPEELFVTTPLDPAMPPTEAFPLTPRFPDESTLRSADYVTRIY